MTLSKFDNGYQYLAGWHFSDEQPAAVARVGILYDNNLYNLCYYDSVNIHHRELGFGHIKEWSLCSEYSMRAQQIGSLNSEWKGNETLP